MNKRKLLIIVIVIIFIMFILMFFVTRHDKIVKIEDKNSCELISLTITDNGTEIEVQVNNNSNKTKKLNYLSIDLYDSNNKKLKTIKQKERSIVEPKSNKIFKITDQKRYLSVNKIKCSVYEIK